MEVFLKEVFVLKKFLRKGLLVEEKFDVFYFGDGFKLDEKRSFCLKNVKDNSRFDLLVNIYKKVEWSSFNFDFDFGFDGSDK